MIWASSPKWPTRLPLCTPAAWWNAQPVPRSSTTRSIPKIEENRDRLLAIEGTVPAPFDLPQGCRFHPRCVFADAACTMQDPALRLLAENHRVACIRAPVEAVVS